MDNKGSVLMQRYELGRLLGQGTFAKVYYARSLVTGHSVAIKVIDKEKVLKGGLVDQIKREISVMRLVRHPNIVQLYEVMATKTKIYFVVEYAKGGELFNKVAKGKLKEDAARKYFQQLINAVDFCHSRGVYHRDLKPENLLLDENDNLKVSDFGLSALAESKRQDGLLHTTCGTPAYVAPEVIKRKGYDGAKADIWSCGVVLFVLLAGYLPFHDSNLMEMYRKIDRAEYKCPRWFPAEVCRLLSRVLDPNPHTRISISKIKESFWFKGGLITKLSKNDTKSKEMAPQNTDPSSGPCENNSTAAEEKQELAKPTNINAFDIISHSDSWFKRKLAKNDTKSKEMAPQNTDPSSGPCENGSTAAEGKQELAKPTNLNAFDIISLSAGFDLNGLFKEHYLKKEARFSSRQPARVIISKLEEIAKRLMLKVGKKDEGLLKMEGTKEGRKGILSIDAEIFEVTPSFYLVEVKKSNGDTLEYQKLMTEGIRPALQDIVWVWQGDQQQQQQQHEQEQLP
ncbi:CBL-interacting protein kinase 28-like [Cornus florida]|uniref:CBL-interacting protein kinase 28-like n=1 Tax=Cornus florida TaxID=4283 RepID=UPI0028967DBE|nr:CBL-interacting protein kinase 28-like [Cornus florida]